MSADTRLVYRFNADVLSVNRAGERITIDVKGWHLLAFTAKAPAYADAIMALTGNGAPLRQLEAIGAASSDPAEASSAVRYYIERFTRARLLAWSIADDGGELAQADALASRFQPRLDNPPAQDLHLCRFAYVHRDETGVALESGLSPVRATLMDRGIQALSERLAKPRPAKGDGFVEALWRLGFLDVAAPQESESRRCWQFHDVLMHANSRHNRDSAAVGGTYRFKEKFPAPPAIKPAVSGETILLPPVDEKKIRDSSDALDEVQSRRRSDRSFADSPIPLSMLSEFLWRVCRTREFIPSDLQDLIGRPYPAGGSINELEFYLAVRHCEGLEPAIYHYDSHNHRCVRIADSKAIAEKLIERSCQAMGLAKDERRPAVTIAITSRLPRLAWKYEGMAYRASLMNAGVVFQTMYLVATDMGLAPCANGTGDSRLLAEATGLDMFEETTIAEFALGMPSK